MTDYCYSTVTFLGNAKVLKQVKEWKAALEKAPAAQFDQDKSKAIFDIFYSDKSESEEIDLGSQWVSQESDVIDAGEYEIGLISPSTPPNEFIQHLSCLLFKLDKHVVVKNNFDVIDSCVGVSYATPYDDENAYFQEAVVQIDSDEYDDLDIAREDAQEKLAELEVEILDFLMDDMEGTVKVIKKHMPKLDVSWDDYS